MDEEDFHDVEPDDDPSESDYSNLLEPRYDSPHENHETGLRQNSQVSHGPPPEHHFHTPFQLSSHELQEAINYEEFIRTLAKDTSSPGGLTTMYGHPELDKTLWHLQEHPDTCAIVSQEYILDAMTGHDFTENELVKEAIEKRYYRPGCGTMPYDVGRLLEDHGIMIERSEFGSIEDIREKLANNQKIIVAVDSNEIWANSEAQQLIDLVFMPQANHALTVIGYDEENQKIIVNDPGHPAGKGMKVDLDDFKNAWQDSNCFMVSTVESSVNGQA